MDQVKLSHSSINRFLMCGESYRLHYIERLRPTTTTSALVFGTAIDNALNNLLLDQDDAEQTFLDNMSRFDLNGTKVDTLTCDDINYFKSDYCFEILTQQDLDELNDDIKFLGLNVEIDGTLIDRLNKEVKEHSRLIRHASFLSLKRKGIMLIDAYRKQLLPKITKVHHVQYPFDIVNQEGDSISGIIDAIVDIEGEGTVILDNKTSGRAYEVDSVLKSEQLSMYKIATGIEKCGYAVVNKTVKLNKKKVCIICNEDNNVKANTCTSTKNGVRCNGELKNSMTPTIDTQLIVDKVSEEMQTKVLNTASEVNNKIHNKVFVKNEKQCYNWFGNKCPYFDLCKNGFVSKLKHFPKEEK